jgi:hypothetical protein
MVVDSTQQTSEYVLTAADRCDADCSAQAYIKVTGITGELLFCVHHYNKIMFDPQGYDKMTNFAYNVIDESEKLIENRLVGEN